MDTERSEKNLNRVQEWIKSADQKVSIFLAFQGLVITLLIPKIQIEKIISSSPTCLVFLDTILLTSSLFLMLFSGYKLISAIIPRLSKTKGKSITYFGDIARMTLSEYKKLLKDTNSNEYEEELINQTHISAKIANNKHLQFREAIIVFCIAICLLLLHFYISNY